jgi:3-methyladenine DNA glycosylase AlkC
MAEPLKLMFSPALVADISTLLQKHDSRFKSTDFKNAVLDKNWKNRELKDRSQHLAQQMNAFLPYDYEEQLSILSHVAPHFKGYVGTVFPNFIELFGLHNEAASLKAIKDFTPYSTSEFAIRPFLKQNPQVIELLYDWSKDSNFHVRRLASEGCRPLLPWAMKLQQYVNEPAPILPILKQLRNDPEDYVYRSVANNLNDISKNQPELVLKLTKPWVNETKTTRWVSKHALRTLLKQGNKTAMSYFGFGSVTHFKVANFSLKRNVIPLGESTIIEIDAKNEGPTANFRIEYAIGYLRKNGQHNEKVFQLKEQEIASNQHLSIQKEIAFKELSTRKHYAGTHYVKLIVNGNALQKLAFELV